MLHLKAFKREKSLIEKLGEGNAHLAWAMGLYLDSSDLTQLASESLTDQHNDKKIDFIRLDRDEKKIIFAQGYYSPNHNSRSGGAKSNKAADLNTAAAWLFSGDLNDVPKNLKSIIQDCRSAIDNGEIEQIDLIYAHNLPESPSVSKELITAALHLQNHLKEKNITVQHRELGLETLERLYTTQETSLAILETINCPEKVLFEETGPEWKAAVLSVPGSWLRGLFEKHGEDLFAANYRGFLGITKRRKINTSIRQTAESDPKNFWVFNNGVTILTNHIERNYNTTDLTGVSIINGAQTTGSIGSSSKSSNLEDVKVLCRIIECAHKETIAKIVRFNNSQNMITTWDSYSNSEEQKRIQKEFSDLGYDYSLKRGFSDQSAEVGIEQVASALVAFQGDFKSANIGKNYIFETKSLYNKAFQNAKARHILLAYAFSKAVDYVRLELKTKNSLIDIEQKQLNLLRNLRFKNYVLSIIGRSLDSIVGERVDLDHVAFTPECARKSSNSFNDLIAYCSPIAATIISFLASSISSDFSEVLKDESSLDSNSSNVGVFLYNLNMAGANPAISSFKDKISPKG